MVIFLHYDVQFVIRKKEVASEHHLVSSKRLDKINPLHRVCKEFIHWIGLYSMDITIHVSYNNLPPADVQLLFSWFSYVIYINYSKVICHLNCLCCSRFFCRFLPDPVTEGSGIPNCLHSLFSAASYAVFSLADCCKAYFKSSISSKNPYVLKRYFIVNG